MHRLLRRQLARHYCDPDAIPEELRAVFDAIDQAYVQADDDRLLVERSLDLMSEELVERNGELRRDLEVREQIATALRESEARTKAILAALPDLVFVLSADGVYREVHAPEPKLLATPISEMIGQNVRELLPEDLATLTLDGVAEALDKGASSLEYCLNVDGIPRRFETRMGASGEDLVVAIVRDVTEKKKMQEQLLLANRMASVGVMAAGVAHEINNPLSFVLGNLDYIAESLASEPAERLAVLAGSLAEAVGEARTGAVRVRDIVRDLKVFSRTESESIGPVDVHQMVESALSMASNQVRHVARLVRDYEPVPAVMANESRLAQVVLNLVVNAAQALDVGEADQNEIRIRTFFAQGMVGIEVADTGPGIPEETLPQIFDPFFSTKEVGVGTGLGLSICHGIVTGLGGQLTVDTRAGSGTTFCISLVPCDAPMSDRPCAPVEGVSGLVARLMVVDDEPYVVAAIRRVLHRCEVVPVDNGRDAIARLIRDDSYDVILCDLMMPGLTGMDVFERIQQVRPTLAERFVFMTGGTFTQRARDFLKVVPNAWMEKPFDANTLRSAIRRRLAT